MQRTSGETTGRTMHVSGVGRTLPASAMPSSWSQRSPRPSERRSDEDRERRARERTIAAWLRSLSR